MFLLKLFFCILHFISITTLIQSQTICLDNSIITCHCTENKLVVACIQNLLSDEIFIDWSTFSSDEYQHYSFIFINFTRLTTQTFTNFSSRFPLLSEIKFHFLNGINQIAENTFQQLSPSSQTRFSIEFNSPRDFQLGDNAFNTSMKYMEFTIKNIQYNTIHNLSYQFNLNAFNNTQIFQIDILNSKEFQFISNQSSILHWEQVTFNNCSLTNVDLLIESLSSELLESLDLSSNYLIQIPSLMKFNKIIILDLQDNWIEEIPSNIFFNMKYLTALDLSKNRIKQIVHDAFIGLDNLIDLNLNNNHLTSLESLINRYELRSFLSPLNQTLHSLDLSNNAFHELNIIENLLNLKSLEICCNQIKSLNEDTFKNLHKLQVINISYNQIESIHPWTFNQTILESLDLSSNPISSLETIITVYDEQMKPKNETTSFLYSIAETLEDLLLANCMNLLEINWFIFTKLKQITSINFSGISKTDQFWILESRDGTPIQWNHHLLNFEILINNIQFNNKDYCLSKPIFQILNQTILFLNENHPCNCFTFMWKNIIYPKQVLNCLSNQSIVHELTKECMHIDSYCSSMISTTTTKPTRNDNGKWKIVLAIVIPLTIVMIILSLAAFYIIQRRNKRKTNENVDIKGGIVNIFTKK